MILRFGLFVLFAAGITACQQGTTGPAVGTTTLGNRAQKLEKLHRQEDKVLKELRQQKLDEYRVTPVADAFVAVHIKEERMHVAVLSLGLASDRLEKAGATREEIDNLNAASAKAVETGSNTDLTKASDTLADLGRKYDIESLVAFKTSKPGATIKYQSTGERLRNETIHTLNDLTDITTPLRIGVYYIWAERKGVATSDKDAVHTIVQKTEPVTLDEE